MLFCFAAFHVDDNSYALLCIGCRDEMKKIEAIIMFLRFDQVKAALKGIGITEFDSSDYLSHGVVFRAPVRTQDYIPDYEPRLKIEFIVDDHLAEKAAQAIYEAAYTANKNSGRVTISPVETSRKIEASRPNWGGTTASASGSRSQPVFN